LASLDAVLDCKGCVDGGPELPVTHLDTTTALVVWHVPRASAMKPSGLDSGVAGNDDRPEARLGSRTYGLTVWSPWTTGHGTKVPQGCTSTLGAGWMWASLGSLVCPRSRGSSYPTSKARGPGAGAPGPGSNVTGPVSAPAECICLASAVAFGVSHSGEEHPSAIP